MLLLNAYPYQVSIEFGFEVYLYLVTVGALSQLMGGHFQQIATEQQQCVAHWLMHDHTAAGGGGGADLPDMTVLRYDL